MKDLRGRGMSHMDIQEKRFQPEDTAGAKALWQGHASAVLGVAGVMSALGEAGEVRVLLATVGLYPECPGVSGRVSLFPRAHGDGARFPSSPCEAPCHPWLALSADHCPHMGAGGRRALWSLDRLQLVRVLGVLGAPPSEVRASGGRLGTHTANSFSPKH